MSVGMKRDIIGYNCLESIPASFVAAANMKTLVCATDTNLPIDHHQWDGSSLMLSETRMAPSPLAQMS